VRRPAALVALLGAALVLLSKRNKARRAERHLWTEASDATGATGMTGPDLR
jgi:hypothetical protein